MEGESRGDNSTAHYAPSSHVVVASFPGQSESGRQTGPSSGAGQLSAPLYPLPSTLLLLHTLASGQGRPH